MLITQINVICQWLKEELNLKDTISKRTDDTVPKKKMNPAQSLLNEYENDV